MFAHPTSLRNLATFVVAICLAPVVQAVTYQDLNSTFGIPLWADDNLWGDEAAAVAQRVDWPEESKTSTDSSYRKYPDASAVVLGTRPYSLALYGDAGHVSQLSLMFANKGDSVGKLDVDAGDMKAQRDLQKGERLVREAVRKDSTVISEKLTALLGPPSNDRYGQGSQVRETVQRWDWKGHSILLSAPHGQYVALRIVPTEVANSQGKSRISDLELRDRAMARIEKRPNGDVVLKDIPMVNQGPKGYCVPATWERVMRYMAVPADMYVLAMAGHTAMGGGTDVRAIADGARTAVVSGGRRFEVENGRISVQTVRKHINHGIPLMWAMYSMPAVNNAMNSRKPLRSQMSDPVEWKKVLDPARKAAKKLFVDPQHAHMCMIVGYNDKTGEIAVSDSWGPAFVERWMTEDEAVAVSQSQGSLMFITY